MEENTPVHPEYIKGFNDGYVMAQYMPEIVQSLSQSKSSSEKMNGLKDGCNQYLKNVDKTNLPAWLRKDRLSKFENKKDDFEKDKESFEKE